MRYNNVELTVKIKGRPITEYPQNGQTFIEGRSGSEFEVVVTNHNPFRVEAVISVDGLSVIDGKEAGPGSSGYVLNAGQQTSIPGWKLSNAQVAAFEFGAKGRGTTYAEQSTGSARNVGVIGVLVYKEDVPVRSSYTLGQVGTLRGQPFNGNPGHWTLHNSSDAAYLSAMQTVNTIQTSLWAGDASGALLGGSAIGTPLTYTSDNTGMLGMASVNMATLSAASPTRSAPRAMGMAISEPAPGAMRSRGMAKSAVREEPAVQNIGTVFGSAQDFSTETITFTRGDMVAMLVLYYDDARGLRSRGIDLSRRAKSVKSQTPDAFPGMSCAPPAGWRG
jgi:hypothetical protein